MRTRFLIPALCGALALFTALQPAVAHHAFGSEFDANAPILLKGKIVKIEWVNPHTWIHVEIVKADAASVLDAMDLRALWGNRRGRLPTTNGAPAYITSKRTHKREGA